jgi:hypothetical protein
MAVDVSSAADGGYAAARRGVAKIVLQPLSHAPMKHDWRGKEACAGMGAA